MWKLPANPSNVRNIDDFKAVTWLMHHKMGSAGEGLQKLNYLWSFTRKSFRRYVKKLQMLYKIPGCTRSWCKLQCAIPWHQCQNAWVWVLLSCVVCHLERTWFELPFSFTHHLNGCHRTVNPAEKNHIFLLLIPACKWFIKCLNY